MRVTARQAIPGNQPAFRASYSEYGFSTVLDILFTGKPQVDFAFMRPTLLVSF